MKKIATTVALLLALSFTFVSISELGIVKSEAKMIVVPDDFLSVFNAVEAASEGDTIYVKSGTYDGPINQTLVIDKSLSLIGEGKSCTVLNFVPPLVQVTIITATFWVRDAPISIVTDDVTISSFTINTISEPQTPDPGIERDNVRTTGNNIRIVDNNILTGVHLKSGSHQTVTKNNITGRLRANASHQTITENIVTKGLDCAGSYGNITNNEVTSGGIRVSGFFNIIKGNTVISSQFTGLHIVSDGNKITDNIVSNHECGISLSGSNNTLKGNKMTNNTSNFCLEWGINWNNSKFVNDIDSSNLADGKPIIYWVNQRDRRVSENAALVALVNCSNIIVENLELSRVGQGVVVAYSTNSKITQNSIQASDEGVLIHSSSGINITDNRMMDDGAGVHLVSSSENTITNNAIIDGGDGIQLTFSSGNTIRNNTLTKRVRGIRMDDSNENIISGNTISGGSFTGVWLVGSKHNVFSVNQISNCRELAISFWDNACGNLFYLNNFVNLAGNVEEYYPRLPEFPINFWDNGAVGNYWNDYYGEDNNGDGIGGTPYVINEDNQDHFPLMDRVDVAAIPEFNSHFFEAGTWEGTTYKVNIVSNSSVSDFSFNPQDVLVRFDVEGETDTTVFCRVMIPKELLYAENGWIVLVNDSPISFSVDKDESNTYLYFAYNYTKKTVELIGTNAIPEFPSWIILPLFLMTVLFAVALKKRIRYLSAT
jgi:parallel beta-helix repeat protein